VVAAGTPRFDVSPTAFVRQFNITAICCSVFAAKLHGRNLFSRRVANPAKVEETLCFQANQATRIAGALSNGMLYQKMNWRRKILPGIEYQDAKAWR
jgi:hypothetical protein